MAMMDYDPKDGIPAGMCLRCGFIHSASSDCINVLRDRIAALEFAVLKRGPSSKALAAARTRVNGARLPIKPES
jgi:hypothetical protein